MSSVPPTGNGDVGEMLEPDTEPEIQENLLDREPGRYKNNRTLLDYFNEETGYSGDGSTRVKLAEIAAGSQEEAFYAFSGLNTFLKKNGFTESGELEDLIIGGGMQLDDPHRWGKRWEGYMREFKTDPYENELPEPDRLDAVLSAADADNFEDEENIGGEYEVKKLLQKAIEENEDQLRGQLESGSAHREYVRDRMAEMLDGIDADLHYSMGEEERGFNRKQKAENLVDRLATRLGKYKEKKEDKRDKLESQKKSELEALEELEPALGTAKKIYQRVQGFYNGSKGNVTQEELRNRRETIFNEERHLLEDIDNAYQQELEEVFSFKNKEFNEVEEEYNELVESYEKDLEAKEELIDNHLGNIDDIESDLSSIRREGSSKIFDLTNRATLSNFDAKALNLAAMEYTKEDLMGKIPDSHLERTKLYEREQAKIESAKDSEFDDLILGHNFMMGDTPSKYQLKRAEGAAEKDFRHLDKGSEGMPDDYTVIDSAGSFRYERLDITGMHTEENQSESESHEVSIMTMPMFQSQDAIIEGVKKGKKNQNIKRAKKEENGDTVTTGALIQTRLEDGSEIPLFLGEDSLTDLGIMTKKLMSSDALTDEDYDELEDSLNHDFDEYWDENEFEGLEEYIESFCAVDPGAMIINADWHIGAEENENGQPSKREKVHKIVDYETDIWTEAKENGNPVGLVLSELVDGDEAWYGAENVNPGISTQEMRQKGTELFEDTRLGELSVELSELDEYRSENSPAEGFYMEAKLDLQNEWMEEFVQYHDEYVDAMTHNMDKTPTGGVENQFNALDSYLPPLMDMASLISLVSGNHISDRMGTDEAERLEDKIQSLAFEEGFVGDLNIEKFSSNGDSGGGFGGITDNGIFPEHEEGTGKLFGFEHETRSSKHHILKVIREYLKSRRYYDEVVYNHIHKRGAAVLGDGTGVTVTSSIENEDNMSQRSGYATANWGQETKLFNASEQSDPSNEFNWHAWHMVGPDTLNSDEWGGDELDQKMETVRNVAQ